ncbi:MULTISPECIES: hypothetical protein [Rhodococcus]|uniref:Uncharacterized protein n=2 Tax=Rhodococcus TaxID=1827 RepID=X0QGY6_RHOWR|nr:MULTISPECIES: hypothetical protein [Rhodococcus]AII05044.1 membrane protein [Rhodococcus opacus]GAF50837.1 hypothetical protein RW1_096_00420 [Rhodococcus wratislaviensis NBRC 100605]
MNTHESELYDPYGHTVPRTVTATEPRRSPLVVRALRALSGAVAAGVVILCLVVIGSAYVGGGRGFPGPGAISITAHVVASVFVIVAQRISDRRDGLVAVVASVAVLAAAALLLATQWWG